jgi:hypothetical protein
MMDRSEVSYISYRRECEDDHHEYIAPDDDPLDDLYLDTIVGYTDTRTSEEDDDNRYPECKESKYPRSFYDDELLVSICHEAIDELSLAIDAE